MPKATASPAPPRKKSVGRNRVWKGEKGHERPSSRTFPQHALESNPVAQRPGLLLDDRPTAAGVVLGPPRGHRPPQEVEVSRLVQLQHVVVEEAEEVRVQGQPEGNRVGDGVVHIVEQDGVAGVGSAGDHGGEDEGPRRKSIDL